MNDFELILLFVIGWLLVVLGILKVLGYPL